MYKIVAKGNHRDMREIEKSIFSGQFGIAVKDLKVYENSGKHKQALEIHKMFLRKGRQDYLTIYTIRKAYEDGGLTKKRWGGLKKNPWKEIELASALWA